MGRPIQRKYVSNNTPFAANVTTAQPAPFQLTAPFPVGDMVYQSVAMRWSGKLNCTTGGGTVVTDGGLQFLRAIYFSTPQHTMLIENVDGIMWHDMQTVRERVRPTHADISGTGVGTTPTFDYFLRLPFKDLASYAAPDLGLDVLRSGNPLLQINLGTYGDFVSGGAAADSVDATSAMEISTILDPGPVTDPDLPTQFQPYFGTARFPISTTVAQYQMFLAFGDRIIKRLFIAQRNSSTLARLANTIIGAADTDRVSLKINSNFPWVDRIEWKQLQEENATDYRLAAIANGLGVFDFVQQILGGTDTKSGTAGGAAGAKLADALSTLSKNQGTLELDADVTTVSNGIVLVGYEAAKILQPGARRPAPAPAQPANG